MRLCSFLLFVLGWVACGSWSTFSPDGGRFAVEMPGAVTLESERMNTPIGYAEYIGGRTESGGAAFRAGRLDLPPHLVRRAGVKAILQGIQQLDAQAAQAKIGEVQWDGDLGGMRYVLFTETGASAHYDLLRDHRLYRLRVSGPPAEVRGAGVERFFGSFRVTP